MAFHNPLGYSVLSPAMTRAAFGYKAVDQYEKDYYGRVFNNSDMSYVNNITEEMEKFGVEFPIKNPDVFENLPEFYIPPLNGDTIAEHFDNIGGDILTGKVKLLKKFANLEVPYPPLAKDLVYAAGWTRYRWNRIDEYETEWEVEPAPDGLAGIDISIFDCETFVKGTTFGHPIMATAVSPDSYWVWMHKSFVDPEVPYTPQLVPTGTTNTLFIAHNVAFDRQRTREAYYLHHDPFHPTEPFGNLWLDTMSMHINVSGLASEQRFMFAQSDKTFMGVTKPAWVDKGSMNNLVDAYNFHCQPMIPLEKETKKTRNLFVVAESMEDFVPNRDELVTYALGDVKTTFELYSVLVLKYLQANPSLTTLYGHFAISSTVLPVVPDWHEWVGGCEKLWRESLDRQDELLSELAEQVMTDWKNDDINTDQDPWLSQLDWEANYALKKDGKPKSVWYGIPGWYRKSSKNCKEQGRIVLEPITTKSRLSHLLLRLKWNSEPIVYDKDKGWTYWDNEKSRYERLPHPAGEDQNVGGVLSKDFLPYFEDGTLSSDLPQAQELIKLAVTVSYWTSVRSRVLEQLPMPALDDPDTLIIIPAAVPMNTASNRSGEALFLTVPDCRPEKIGTEIKSRIQTKSPYTFVGTDFDAEEAVVASIFSDSHYKVAGSTQFSHSILAGSKDDGSDMHSRTASTIGVSRSTAKGLNYALLYSAGAKTLANSIRKGNKSISMDDAIKMAKRLIAVKKGTRASKNSITLIGGSDSYAYNEMARIANMSTPQNPLSLTKMSTAFRPSAVGGELFTTRSNWIIQSTGSAILHAFLTSMEYLLRKYNVSARFSMSVHDSLLYMCKEEDADLVAALYQVSHLHVWSYLRYRYDICEMPHANAWFSSIEVDKVFRKSATAGTTSISQPVSDPDGRAHTITTLVPVLNSLRTLEPAA
jgi:DNA polymerase gamma 1